MKRLLLLTVFFLPALVLPSMSQAQNRRDPAPIIEDLAWVDNGYLDRQRQLIDEISRSEFGRPLRRDLSDLTVLERIVANELVNRTETQKLQAMGVVLGDIYVAELNMQWRVYNDRKGKSRAICLPNTRHCLFPVTMISRRAEAGSKLDIRRIYDRGLELMRPYIPKLPYSVK